MNSKSVRRYGSLGDASSSSPVFAKSGSSSRMELEIEVREPQTEEAQPLLTEPSDRAEYKPGSSAYDDNNQSNYGYHGALITSDEEDANALISNIIGKEGSTALSSSDLEDEDGVGFVRRDGSSGRDSTNSISSWDTIIHLLKGNIGTGILAMPDAIKNSGLLVGNVGLVLMSIICVHCMHMLIRCAQELAPKVQKSKLTYPEVAQYAFSTSSSRRLQNLDRHARRTINVFLCITQLGFCCVYFVFCAKNIKLVMDHHFGERDYHVYMVALLPLVLLLCSIKNLKYLSPVSLFANVIQTFGLIIIFYYICQDLPRTWERKLVANWYQYPLYFGTAIYAFEGIGVVLPLENQMRYPQEMRGWNGVLNTSMVIVSCLYISIGFFGYLKYGEDVEASITLNLPVEEKLAQAVILMFTVAIFFSYALQFYVPIEITYPWFERKFPNRKMACNYALRYSVVLLTFALAAAIPRLDLFISLVGAASSSTLALMAPPILDLLVFWNVQTRTRIMKNVFIFLVGFVGFLTGSYVSLKNIIDYFVTGN